MVFTSNGFMFVDENTDNEHEHHHDCGCHDHDHEHNHDCCLLYTSPYHVVLNSLPKTALAPIIIVWLGNNTKSIILIALLTSVIITIMTVLNGFLETDKDKMKLITILGGKMCIRDSVISLYSYIFFHHRCS